MMRILKIGRDQLKGRSLPNLLYLVKRELFRHDTILIYELYLPKSRDREPWVLDEIRIKKGNISDLLKCEGRVPPLPWEFCCHKYDGVRDFFVAVNRNGIQHISWIYYHGDPNRIIKLGKKDAEIKYSLTLPAFRGKGLYPEVIKTIAFYLGQRGFQRVFISVDHDNSSSIRGIQKAGFQHVCQIRVRKIFGIQKSAKYTPSEL